MDFGAFIELQGLRQRYEGLVHVSEISKTRPGSAKEVLKHGQEVWVKVLRITATGGKQQVSLSMRDVDQVRNHAHYARQVADVGMECQLVSLAGKIKGYIARCCSFEILTARLLLPGDRAGPAATCGGGRWQ
jgi:predicted RNA-binding protein with RPS1 domain